MYVLDGEEIVERQVTFTPGLFKIFDEIVVNAADNKQRDPSMDTLEVTVDADTNTISVKNNGKGIPIVLYVSSRRQSLIYLARSLPRSHSADSTFWIYFFFTLQAQGTQLLRSRTHFCALVDRKQLRRQ